MIWSVTDTEGISFFSSDYKARKINSNKLKETQEKNIKGNNV